MTSSKMSLSFLDMLFGSLGAVALLLMIILSVSGPPPVQRVESERMIVWKIEANVKAIQPGRITFTLSPSGETTAESHHSAEIDGDSVTVKTLERDKEVFQVIPPDENSTGKATYICSLALSDDEKWSPSLSYVLTVVAEEPEYLRISTAMVRITPAVEKEQGNGTLKLEHINSQSPYRFKSIFTLCEQKDGGYSGRIEEFTF